MCYGYLTAHVSRPVSSSKASNMWYVYRTHENLMRCHELVVYSASSGWRSSELLSHYQAIMLGK
ncbi:hypothetical protein F383_32347 [Gossypium arboreum]|uniref:Uncharacterized protein n=1 Tax=Gossypium arboreum TaxID=29729 RepID=A0A0B0PKN2_GOSAR|nr:hypothetical protein F383_32347 [Gossypium arboreum]